MFTYNGKGVQDLRRDVLAAQTDVATVLRKGNYRLASTLIRRYVRSESARAFAQIVTMIYASPKPYLLL